MGCGSWRSISRTRTPAVGGARAIRSMPSWRPGCSWLARPGRFRSRPDGIVESIRLLRAARHGAVESRRGALVQLRDLGGSAPQELRDRLSPRKTLRGKATLCRRLRPSIGELCRPSRAAEFALRSIARRIDELDDEIAVLDRRLERLGRAAPLAPAGCSGSQPARAGQLLVTAGQNIERLRGEAAFASLCGARSGPGVVRQDHPPPAQPWRQANRSLHLIAVCRLRYCPGTRAYAKRRTAEGKTKAEIMRCLKRYSAREAHNALRADLAASPHPTPRTTTTIYCGAGPIAITRRRT
jgi:transposase